MEMQLMQQMFSGLSQVTFIWMQVALLLAMVGVRAWRPEAIKSHSAFRWAGSCLALSIILPAIVSAVLSTTFGGLSVRGRGGDPGFAMMLYSIPAVIPGLFVGGAVYLMLAAISGSPQRHAPPAEPKPHPLD